MAYLGQDLVGCKIVVDNKCLQVKHFKYLCSEIAYEKCTGHSTKKLPNFSQILGIPNNIFKPILVQKFSRTKVYNELDLPILLCKNEVWTLRTKDKNDCHQYR
jgi:hypothetical protein